MIKLTNNMTKNDLRKILKETGFVEEYSGEWVVPNNTGDSYYDNVFSIGTKYMSYAIGYEIRKPDKNKRRVILNHPFISFERDREAKITYKLIHEDMLRDLINRVWQMYKEAQVELKEAQATEDFV